jgi:hypothetical protein
VEKTVVGPEKKARPEPADHVSVPPGHFVTPEHRTDLERFLAEVKSRVEHRQRRDEPRAPWRRT